MRDHVIASTEGSLRGALKPDSTVPAIPQRTEQVSKRRVMRSSLVPLVRLLLNVRQVGGVSTQGRQSWLDRLASDDALSAKEG
jgi:hypothetical protein